LTAGVTFNPTDNLAFEAACGIGNNNNINVFAIGRTGEDNGLFNFGSILVSLKF
jgi:hypothetical protein